MVESFEERLKRICEARGLSIPQVCDLAGLKYKTLNAAFARKSRIPHETVDDICNALNIPMTYFSRHAPQMSLTAQNGSSALMQAAANLMDSAMQVAHMETLRRQSSVGMMDVLNWLQSTGGELICFDALSGYCDLFEVMNPDDTVPTPYQIGHNSLCARSFNISSNEQYTRLFRRLDPSFLEGIKRGRIEAKDRPFLLVLVEMKVQVRGEWITETYWRLTANVKLPKGHELTLVFAEPAPNSRASARKSGRYDLIQQLPNHEVDHQAE